MNSNYWNLLAMFAAGLLVVMPASGQETKKAAPKIARTDAVKATTIDLRSKTKQMSLREGSNVVYKGPDFKLTAVARRGKVYRWVATDNNGKPLPTAVAQGVLKCEVCVTIQTGTGQTKVCTVVDCSILEKAKTSDVKAQ